MSKTVVIRGSLQICCLTNNVIALKCPNVCKLVARLCKLA